MKATYAQLKDGSWGLRVENAAGLAAGSKVKVEKKDGTTKTEIVGKVLWSGICKFSGLRIHLCAIQSADGSSKTAGCRKCSECGVVESSLNKNYEKMLTTKAYGVICSPCWKDRKDGWD